MPTKSIEDVLKQHTPSLMKIKGVVGTGQGLCNNNPCIKVFVVEKKPEIEKKIAKCLDGFPVVLEETGNFKSFRTK